MKKHFDRNRTPFFGSEPIDNALNAKLGHVVETSSDRVADRVSALLREKLKGQKAELAA